MDDPTPPPDPIAVPPFLEKIRTTHLAAVPTPSPPFNPSTTSAPGLYLPPPLVPSPEEDLVPPENFALVSSGVYRCGFPKKRNFRFMETLRLKTVL